MQLEPYGFVEYLSTSLKNGIFKYKFVFNDIAITFLLQLCNYDSAVKFIIFINNTNMGLLTADCILK